MQRIWESGTIDALQEEIMLISHIFIIIFAADFVNHEEEKLIYILIVRF